MKILLLADYYPDYLKQFYHKNSYDHYNYQENLEVLLDDYFGSFGSYFRHLKKIGHDVFFIIGNDYSLQNKWVLENKFPVNASAKSKKIIVLEQIRRFSPDIFFMGSMFDYYGEFLADVQSITKNIFTWIACPFPGDLDFQRIKCVITSTDIYVEKFRKMGVSSCKLGAGFDVDILTKLHNEKKTHNISFIGGLGVKTHSRRVAMIRTLLSKNINMDLFGYGLKKPSFFWQDKTLYSAYKGQLWGIEMYQTLRDSLLSLNIHIDVAEGFAGNMRMYEVTGCGSLLLTEMTPNLNQIFNINSEVVAYFDADDLEKKLMHFLNNPREAQNIAENGQKACHRLYTYEKRVKELEQIFLRFAD